MVFEMTSNPRDTAPLSALYNSTQWWDRTAPMAAAISPFTTCEYMWMGFCMHKLQSSCLPSLLPHVMVITEFTCQWTTLDLKHLLHPCMLSQPRMSSISDFDRLKVVLFQSYGTEDALSTKRVGVLLPIQDGILVHCKSYPPPPPPPPSLAAFCQFAVTICLYLFMLLGGKIHWKSWVSDRSVIDR